MQAEMASPRILIDPNLYKAARDGDINLLRRHLITENSTANGGSLLGVTYTGDNALHLATYYGHFQVAKRICSENRSLLLMVNNKSETPLHYAAQAGKCNLVSHFIQEARNEPQLRRRELLRRRNRDGETALYQAVHNKHFAVVWYLIWEDPDLAIIPENNSASPLYVAAKENSVKVASCSIGSFQGTMGKGQDSGPVEQRALQAAAFGQRAMQNSDSIVALLIQHLGGNVSTEAYAGPRGQTALHAAAFGQKDIVQKILLWKPDLAIAKDETGSTPLHYAASADNIDAVQSLLENDDHKTPAYIADSSGLYPVHVAAKLSHVGVVSQLFELCPDSDELLDAQGRNFLHTAVENRQVPVVWWAWKNNRLDRSINAKDDEGNTPLHLAVKARNLTIFALLLESKTLDLDIINKKGLTPLDLAKAQRTYSFHLFLSRDIIIHLTLMVLRSRGGIRRWDHFLKEYKLEQEKEMEREAENFDNMAKSTSTVSVLIASASFAGTFAVSGAYRAHLGNPSGLNLVDKAFIITIAYAFICSIAATGLYMLATTTFMDSTDRRKSFLGSLRLVQSAIEGLVMAFAFGVYVILTPVSKWLAILICLASAGVVPILINPMPRINIMIAWALVRSTGWKELWRRGRYSLFFPWHVYYHNTLYPGFLIVLIIVLFSLFEFSQHNLVLITTIIVPLFLHILACLELLLHHESN